MYIYIQHRRILLLLLSTKHVISSLLKFILFLYFFIFIFQWKKNRNFDLCSFPSRLRKQSTRNIVVRVWRRHDTTGSRRLQDVPPSSRPFPSLLFSPPSFPSPSCDLFYCIFKLPSSPSFFFLFLGGGPEVHLKYHVNHHGAVIRNVDAVIEDVGQDGVALDQPGRGRLFVLFALFLFLFFLLQTKFRFGVSFLPSC
jgi:hypothetical protein